MLRKLYNLAAIVSLAAITALAGLGGYLGFTGRLTSERIEQVAHLLRAETAQPAEPAPASQPATQPAEPASEEDLQAARLRGRLERALLQRAAADAKARQELVEHAVQNLITLQENFDRQRKEWEEQRKKVTASVQDEGFERELEYVAKLPPRMAKEHILRTWRKQQADAVRLFMALKPASGQRILEQFKTAEELDIAHELLEQLRLQNVTGISPGQGRPRPAPEP